MSYDELLVGGQTPELKEQKVKPKLVRVTDLFEMSNQTALKVAKDPAMFREYLELQSRFERYSVSNVFLLLAQKPEATMIGDYASWQEKEVYIRKGEKAFYILDPKGDHKRPDGTIGPRFAVKKMFDVSQTTYVKPQEPEVSVDEREMIQALIHDQSCSFVIDNDLSFGVCAEYRPQEKCVHVVQGLPGPVLFRSLAAQIAAMYMGSDSEFHTTAAAYLVCRRAHMEPPEIEIMPENFAEMDAGKIREELTQIRKAGNDLTLHLNNSLKAIQKKAQEVQRGDGNR